MYVYIVQRRKSSNNNSRTSKKKPPSSQPSSKTPQRRSRNSTAVVAPPHTYVAPLPRRRRVRTTPTSLSKCALKYALAIAEPFHPNARNACLPSYPAVPSQKVTGFTRFIMTTGTTGFGFVALCPTLSNNEPVAFFSTSTYTGSAMQILTSNNTYATGVSDAKIPNLPYTTDDLTSGFVSDSEFVTGRLVSLGLRITYTGTTLNQSGVYYLYSSPNHQNVTRIADSTGELGALSETEVCGVTRNPCELRCYPVSAEEAAYNNSLSYNNKSQALFPYSNSATDFAGFLLPSVTGTPSSTVYVGSPIAVVLVSGLPANSSFLVEIVEHVEYAGQRTSSVSTNTEADQRGFEMVTAAAQRLPSLKNAQPEKTFLTLMRDAIGEVATALKPIAVDALKMGAMSLLV